MHGDVINTNRILVGKPEGKRSLRRPRHRWENNIKVDLMATGFGDVDCIHMPQDRNQWWALANVVMSIQVR
jgi:hypothetical protein